MGKNGSDREARVRSAGRSLAAGAMLVANGVALGLVAAPGWAGPLTLFGLVLLASGLHRYGRLGADPSL